VLVPISQDYFGSEVWSKDGLECLDDKMVEFKNFFNLFSKRISIFLIFLLLNILAEVYEEQFLMPTNNLNRLGCVTFV